MKLKSLLTLTVIGLLVFGLYELGRERDFVCEVPCKEGLTLIAADRDLRISVQCKGRVWTETVGGIRQVKGIDLKVNPQAKGVSCSEK